MRGDFFGDWVVCSTCELPFAWREASTAEDAASAPSNSANGARGNGTSANAIDDEE